MNLNRSYLLFYWVTTLGSSASAISTFLRLEPLFGTAGHLSFALACRTLAMLLFGLICARLLQTFGMGRCLRGSQLFGIGAVGLLSLGFSGHQYFLCLLGMIATGLPGILVTVALLSQFKSSSTNQTQFRGWSGSREVALGLSQVVAGALVPMALKAWGIQVVFFVDALSYAFGYLLVPRSLKSEFPQRARSRSLSFSWDRNAIRFMVLSAGPLLLVGWIPLLAGSPSLTRSLALSEKIREYLWIVEGATLAASGSVYWITRRWLSKPWLQTLLGLNALWLVAMIYQDHWRWVYISCALIPLTMNLLTVKLRDDAILSAGQNLARIQEISALTLWFRSILSVVSPLILAGLLESIAFAQFAWLLLIFQVILFVIGRTALR